MDVDPVTREPVLEIASEHLTERVPVVSEFASVSDVIGELRGQRYDTVAGIVVCEGRRFVGLVDAEDLLASPEQALIRDIMDRDPPVVTPGVDQEIAAWRAAQRDETCLVVLDDNRDFLGVIPPERLISILLTEHDEDMARLSGLLRGMTPARDAAEESIRRRFLHRIPWLIVGMAGAFLAANLMGSFEAHLQRHVVLAFFVPSIVYLAAAVGGQSSTIVIRGLSVGVTIPEVYRRELIAGLLVGIVVSIAFFPVVWLWWGDATVALAVSLSLAAACSLATLIAVVLPWLLNRFGFDPAFGSGPLATVLQDLCTILLYLGISFFVLSG